MNRTFVFGDIHGCVNELRVLFTYLIVACGLSKEDRLCFLGDYVDRGPYSREVIDSLIQIQETFPKARFLKGNHEAMLLDYLGIEKFPNTFVYLQNTVGGKHTLKSYGVSNIPLERNKGSQCLSYFPDNHIEFLTKLELYKKTPEYIFVHAGVNPLVADMRMQNPNELMRIQMKMPHQFKQVVVHGHKAVEEVMFDSQLRIINIDTDVVHGGSLTCLELSSMQTYQVALNSIEIVVKKLIPS